MNQNQTIETSLLLPTSTLTKHQTKTYRLSKQSHLFAISLRVHLRFDDSCNNGHNTFAMTGEYKVSDLRTSQSDSVSGAIHSEIEQHFPEFRHLIKWHLWTTDGPYYYIENTKYHVEQNNIQSARQTANWPDATPEQLLDESALMARLPALMREFKQDMVSLGFEY